MSHSPNVSVIIAAYNEEKFISRAIRSVLNQSMDRSKYEIIVVNDQSTDKTLSAISTFLDEIKIISNEKNIGLAASLNKGIKAAKGKFIVRLDGDDYVSADYLHILSEYLEQNKYMEAVSCDYILVDDQERVINRCSSQSEPIGCGIMFRVESLISIGLYDEDFLMNEDKDLRLRFEKHHKIYNVELPLYRYRMHEANMTKNQKAMEYYDRKFSEKHHKIDGVTWSGRGHDFIEREIEAAVFAMKNANPLTQGKYLKEFEGKFSKFIGVENCFAVTSCASALELAAMSSGLDSDSEVIIPAHTYAATAIPFARTGARIVWADIDADTFVVTREKIESLITAKTKVVVVVHLYGLSCDMDEIEDMCKQHNLILVEDVAQAIGGLYKGKRLGAIGDFGCFSFHGAKNLSTLGEGGVLSVKSNEIAKLIPGLRHNGMKSFENQGEKYWLPAMSNVATDIKNVWPCNFSMCEPQAAVGIRLLDRIDTINEEKKEKYFRFRNALLEVPELKFQKIPDGHGHVYHLVPARYNGTKFGKTRDDLIELLYSKYNIKTVVQYYPLYRYDLFIDHGYGNADCPFTDDFFDNMLSFPFHHGLSYAELDYMIESVVSACRELRDN